MLEENLRELQVSSADALASEQRRSKDLIARLEREKVSGQKRIDDVMMFLKFESYFQALESENFAFRTQHLEKENALLQEEAVGLRAQVNR